MENLACTEGINKSIDELDKLISEAESLLEDYAVPSSAYDSGISDRDIGENTGNDDIRQSIDQLDAILRQYDSGTIDVDTEPGQKLNRKLDHQRHSLDGHIDGPDRTDRCKPVDNGAERFEAGDRHSIADPGGLDWHPTTDVTSSNSRVVTSQNVTTASRNVNVQGTTQDSSSDDTVAMTTTTMAQMALGRRCLGDYDKHGPYTGANGVYRADSMRSLPPPPEELLYGEAQPPGGVDSIYDYPNYPPQGVAHHEQLPPPPGEQQTNNKQCDRKRPPPALPKRSPSTRLSTASTISDPPSSPNSQLTSPRFSRCSSDSYDNRHSQDPSQHSNLPVQDNVYSNPAHDLRSPGQYQRSYSVPNAHDSHNNSPVAHAALHAQSSSPQSAYGQPTGHPGQAHGQPSTQTPESNGVSQKSRFFEQKMDEEAVVLRLKKGNLVDAGERPPSFTPPPPPASNNNHRWQPTSQSGPPAPPNVIAKRSPVHQRLHQVPRRMSEQIPPALSPDVSRRSSETCLPPRASSFRGMPTQPIVPTSPVSPPAVSSKPVSRSNSTGTDVRSSPAREEGQHNVRPSMFKHTAGPPNINNNNKQRIQQPVMNSTGSSPSTSDSEGSFRQASPAPQAPRNSDVIENEGLLKPSKIKSIIGGQGKTKPKIQHQQSAPAAPQVPHVPQAPHVPVQHVPQAPTSSFGSRQKSTPVAVPSVPKVPTVPIRTGRTPPQQELVTSPPRKNSADLIGEVSTFKLKKKKKSPVGAGKKGPVDTIQSEIVSNLKVGVKLKRRSDGPVIPEIHGDEGGICDIDDLPPPPPDFADDYYAEYYQQNYQYQTHEQQQQQQQQQQYVQSGQLESPTNGRNRGMAMAVHEHTPPPATNGRKDSDEDIDLSQIPGFVPIPDNCPLWKIGMLEKKNREAYEKYMRNLEERAMEDAKWQDIPAWKRNLMQKKELKKKEESAPSEEEKKRYDEEYARLESMPEWKRQIILKKRLDERM